MSVSVKNLTDPEAIIHEFLIKDSRHALAKFAASTGYSRPYISQHVHGHRKNRKVLQLMADHLGCGVHGVMPQNTETRPESAAKEEKKRKVPSSGRN